MKTRKYLIALLIILLSGCSLASKPNDKQTEPKNPLDTLTFVGLYFVPYTSLDEISDDFNINDNTQTFVLLYNETEGEEIYSRSHTSGSLYDSQLNINVSEGTTKKEFTAKIPVISGMDVYHRVHKVFKDNIGNYHLKESMNNLNISSISANVTNTTDLNGELTGEDISISIDIVEFDPLIQISVLQMDENYAIVDEKVAIANDSITLLKETKITLVEETRESSNKGVYKQVTSYTNLDFNEMNELTHSSLVQQDGLYGTTQLLIIKAAN